MMSMKRIFALSLSVLLLLSGCALKKDQKQKDIEIYENFFSDGGLQQVSSYTVDEGTEMQTVLCDLNEDGRYEMLVELNGSNAYNYRESLLLGIQDETVCLLHEQSYGGGSMGGALMSVKYDTVEGRHCMIAEGSYGNEGDISEAYLEVLEYNGKEVMPKENYRGYTLYLEPEYPDNLQKAEQIKLESPYWYERETEFRYYRHNGAYIEEKDYDQAVARYVDVTATDYEWQTVPITDYLPLPEK